MATAFYDESSTSVANPAPVPAQPPAPVTQLATPTKNSICQICQVSVPSIEMPAHMREHQLMSPDKLKELLDDHDSKVKNFVPKVTYIDTTFDGPINKSTEGTKAYIVESSPSHSISRSTLSPESHRYLGSNSPLVTVVTPVPTADGKTTNVVSASFVTSPTRASPSFVGATSNDHSLVSRASPRSPLNAAPAGAVADSPVVAEQTPNQPTVVGVSEVTSPVIVRSTVTDNPSSVPVAIPSPLLATSTISGAATASENWTDWSTVSELEVAKTPLFHPSVVVSPSTVSATTATTTTAITDDVAAATAAAATTDGTAHAVEGSAQASEVVADASAAAVETTNVAAPAVESSVVTTTTTTTEAGAGEPALEDLVSRVGDAKV